MAVEWELVLTIVALVAFAIAFAAYVGTWIHARVEERSSRNAEQAGLGNVDAPSSRPGQTGAVSLSGQRSE